MNASTSPPRENVNADWIAKAPASATRGSRERQDIVGLSASSNAHNTPSPSIAETWFGPNPPLVTKVDALVKSIVPAETVEKNESAAMLAIGPSIARKTAP